MISLIEDVCISTLEKTTKATMDTRHRTKVTMDTRHRTKATMDTRHRTKTTMDTSIMIVDL